MNITMIHWNLLGDMRPIYRVHPIVRAEAAKEKPRRNAPVVVGATIDIYA